jgi:hypothetical protein
MLIGDTQVLAGMREATEHSCGYRDKYIPNIAKAIGLQTGRVIAWG